MSRRTTRVGLLAAVLLSGLWMWAVPDYVHHYEVTAAAGYARNVALACRDAHVTEQTSSVDCRQLMDAAFDAALDPVVKSWPVAGPYAYAAAMLLLLWAAAGGIALTIDWLRRGFGLYHSA